MTYTPTMQQLSGLSYETASLYGMPHLGAAYSSDSVNDTKLTTLHPICAACGRTTYPFSKHHEPPRSKGHVFLLKTDMGQFVLRPALIVLCGSGVTGCHGDRHNGRLSIRWEWDSDESAERWWSGDFLAHKRKPNEPWLFEHGRYVFENDSRTWEVRHVL